jgi:hypothetical protein
MEFQQNPCTLDSAVRTAKAGDLIVVEDGTYVVSSSLYFPSLVNIVSRNGPKSTIIQGKLNFINNIHVVNDAF